MRRAPLTVGYTVLAVLLGILTGSLPDGPGPAVLDAAGTGVGGRWWSPLTAIPLWGGLAGHLVTAALVLGAGLVAERRIGALRTAALLVGTQVIGTLLTLGAVTAGAAAGGAWAGELAEQVAVGGAPGAVGLLLAVSHVLSALWRRRIRLVLLVGVVMLVAYSGELSDSLLLFSAVTGLAAGPLVLRRAAPLRPGAPSRAEGRVLVALVVAASAVGPVVAAIAQAPIGPLSVLQFVVLSPPPDAATVQQICATAAAEVCRSLQAQLRLSGIGPAIASAVPVLLLLVTAEGLRRGRRAAWVVGIALNLVLAALGVLLAVQVTAIPAEQLVVYGGAPGARQVLALVLPPLLPLAVAGLLVLTRARFPVRAPAGTYRRLIAVAAATLVGVGALYVFGGTLVADGFDRPPRTGELAVDLPLRFLPPGYLGEVEPAFLPQDLVATLLFEWSGAVFWLVVAAGLMRSFVAARPEGGSADAARALLRTHGGSHLGWLTTWPGHAYWFAAGGDAAVAYRVIGSVALTTGDPFGAPGARAGAVAGFAAHCAERGLTPAFYSVPTTPARCARRWAGARCRSPRRP